MAGSEQLIDRILPRFDVGVVEHVVVGAGAAETYAAIERADVSGDRVLGALGSVRQWPELVAAGRLGIDVPVEPRTLGDVLGPGLGWIALGEVPGSERVVGLVGRPNPFELRVEHVLAEDFASFAEPGFARAVVAFAVRPLENGTALLGVELRVQATDDETRRMLRGAWFVAGRGARTVAGRVLALVKKEAERSGPQPAEHGHPDGDHGDAGDLQPA